MARSSATTVYALLAALLRRGWEVRASVLARNSNEASDHHRHLSQSMTQMRRR